MIEPIRISEVKPVTVGGVLRDQYAVVMERPMSADAAADLLGMSNSADYELRLECGADGRPAPRLDGWFHGHLTVIADGDDDWT